MQQQALLIDDEDLSGGDDIRITPPGVGPAPAAADPVMAARERVKRERLQRYFTLVRAYAADPDDGRQPDAELVELEPLVGRDIVKDRATLRRHAALKDVPDRQARARAEERAAAEDLAEVQAGRRRADAPWAEREHAVRARLVLAQRELGSLVDPAMRLNEIESSEPALLDLEDPAVQARRRYVCWRCEGRAIPNGVIVLYVEDALHNPRGISRNTLRSYEWLVLPGQDESDMQAMVALLLVLAQSPEHVVHRVLVDSLADAVQHFGRSNIVVIVGTRNDEIDPDLQIGVNLVPHRPPFRSQTDEDALRERYEKRRKHAAEVRAKWLRC